jgi:uncharacterized protein YprB with RNaseH-like and TPR domain/predicted nuclease with RNAse H fold
VSASASIQNRESLLSRTFVHFAGIGSKTEARLWDAGVRSWSDLAGTGFGQRRGVPEMAEESAAALANSDIKFFYNALPARERWRAFADFGADFVAVDIETTGLSIYDQVTVVGIEAHGEYRTFIAGSNLDEAQDLLSAAKGLVTFNGALFDLPFLARTFPALRLPEAHVDLRFLARRVGLAGSLKTVEELAQLKRAQDLGDISGYEATVLWSRYEFDGAGRALERLVRYNAADTLVLRPLAELVVERMQGELEHRQGGGTLQELSLFDQVPSVRRVRRARGRVGRAPGVQIRAGKLRVGRTTVALPERRGVEPEITLAGLQARMRDPQDRIVGIDLTGSEARPTGWALLQDGYVVTGTLGSDQEILKWTLACKPRVVSIDSPLSMPVGRHCGEDSCPCREVGGITRECERELKRRGVNVYPCLIQSMQALTKRGTALAQALRQAGVEVIESYPGAAQDIMRIPRKRASQEQLRAGLARFGIAGLRPAGIITHDELDAATSAAVGAFYLADLYEALGNPEEDYLIIPAIAGTTLPATGQRLRTQPADFAIIGDLGSDGAQRLDDLDEYLPLLAQAGPRLRLAHVAQPGTRIRKRPGFADVAVHADAPHAERTLRRWRSNWEPSPVPAAQA